MVQVEQHKIKAIGCVLNNKNRPLKERFRALFTLKNIGGPDSIQAIADCFEDDSALLKHELAYCLGQMQDKTAIPVLVRVLEDTKQEPMVRHEAAEALGAIGSPEVINTLEKYRTDPVIEVAETCEIALDRVKWMQRKDETLKDNNPFASVDPTPPATSKNVDDLKKIYLNEEQSLFERYRAMFALRNIQTEDSILALTEGLKCSSALFRHEVAFVLGQLQHPCSVPHLAENLRNNSENEMVRHECAEALGAIASDECRKILNDYLEDDKRVVKESCEIALDMCEYENSPEFQYANTLSEVQN
uniref:Deoxyhypusine hydroxylase n=1 Tax=Tabanus bromius TaxID=304241 RepID=A0A0K8TR96_TABBR